MPLEYDGLGAFAFQPLKSELLNAIRKGSKSKPFKLPQNKKKPVMKPFQKKRLELLKSWRSNIGKELNIDPSLVWHAASLERIARDSKLTINELNSPEVRAWQVQNFQKSLSKFISDNGINK
jgi:ribonuclease D